MKECEVCGELLESHVRYHWLPDGDGHYVTRGSYAKAKSEEIELAAVSPKLPACVRRASRWWGSPPQRAPAVSLERAPAKPWGKEDDLRRAVIELLELRGFFVYDLEQGFRADESSRQTPGIGDAYFVHIGQPRLELQGWIETKRWDNEPSEDQYTFGSRVLEAGGIYLLVYELAQIERWLEGVL